MVDSRHAGRHAAEARWQAKNLISVIDDGDVRISMASLMESLGFTIEGFPSAVFWRVTPSAARPA
jgi:hypothetical protein